MTPTSTLIDAIVLVFSRSKLRDLVGTDALKTVLEGSARDLFPQPGMMSLQPVWDLLETQEGFQPDLAIPPLCRLKTWQPRLGVVVELPAQAQHLEGPEIETQAMYCAANEDDLEKLLKPKTVPIPSAARVVEVASDATEEDRRAPSNRRLGFALVFMAIAIAAASFSIWYTFRETSDTKRLAPADLSAEIPLRDVRQSGPTLAGTLSDPQWVLKPEGDRRRALEAALLKAVPLGAKRFMVFDSTGKLRATSVLVNGKPVVTFQK